MRDFTVPSTVRFTDSPYVIRVTAGFAVGALNTAHGLLSEAGTEKGIPGSEVEPARAGLAPMIAAAMPHEASIATARERRKFTEILL
jgi:hypothetical protein